VNLALELPPELEDAVDPVHAEIIQQLRAQGARVAVVWPPDAALLWRAALAAVRASPELPDDLATAAGVFARGLGEEADFDLLVMPSLAIREARLSGNTARWDGVQRRLSVRGRTPAAGRSYSLLEPGSVEPGVVVQPGRARISGLSLHVLVVTPEGRPLHQGWGGLDLLQDALATAGAGGSLVLAPRLELLERPDHVSEGVRIALAPYLEPSAR
jgi:hypothetical protein